MKNEAVTPFEAALLKVSLREFEDIPEEESLHHEFSPSFEAKMERIIRKAQKNYWSTSKIVLRRALLIAAIIVALLLAAYAIPAVQEFFIDFFINDKGTHYEFTYDPAAVANAPECIETVYAPTYIPKDYEIITYDCCTPAVMITWCNKDDAYISYLQRIMPENPLNAPDSGLDAEHTSWEWITFGNFQVLRFENEWSKGYIWATSEYRFDLICPTKLSDRELNKIFYSITEDEDAIIVNTDEMQP